MFKKQENHIILIFNLLIITTLQTCWLQNNHILIKQSQIEVLSKYQFSVHPTSGIILSKQDQDQNQQPYFKGDFGMLRMYGKESVAVYEGIYMKIKPLIHQVPSLFKEKYSHDQILELQIMYELTFGKMKDRTYQQIGMSYFLVGSKIQNQTQKIQSAKFVHEILSLDQNKRFKIEQQFNKFSNQRNKNLLIYKAKNENLKTFLQIGQSKSKQCQDMLWIIQRNTIAVSQEDLKKLKEEYRISEFKIQQKQQETENSKQKTLKIYTVKLRSQNKRQITISAKNKKLPQNSNKKPQNPSQKQSNSCPQSDHQQL